MPTQSIASGANFVFGAGTINAGCELDNRHNVAGDVRYQIGVQPQVTIPMVPNGEYRVPNVNGEQFSVHNGLPNTLDVVY